MVRPLGARARGTAKASPQGAASFNRLGIPVPHPLATPGEAVGASRSAGCYHLTIAEPVPAERFGDMHHSRGLSERSRILLVGLDETIDGSFGDHACGSSDNFADQRVDQFDTPIHR
jgi:hypothetical protein